MLTRHKVFSVEE
uniref:Uncharacterized protein n=1 Tax=Anguilla anguilla TaxID=7936 RepID=A0A0E9T2J3_ANGAN